MVLPKYYIYQNAGSKDANSTLLSLAKKKAKTLAKSDRDGIAWVMDRKTRKTFSVHSK